MDALVPIGCCCCCYCYYYYYYYSQFFTRPVPVTDLLWSPLDEGFFLYSRPRCQGGSRLILNFWSALCTTCNYHRKDFDFSHSISASLHDCYALTYNTVSVMRWLQYTLSGSSGDDKAPHYVTTFLSQRHLAAIKRSTNSVSCVVIIFIGHKAAQ